MGKLILLFILSVIGISLLSYFNVSFAWFGHLPGDMSVNYSNTKIYLPLTTSLIVSFALSLFLWIFGNKAP